MHAYLQDEFQNLDDMDLESAEFKNLPAEIQHEVLTEIKAERRRNHWANIEELPEVRGTFTE